MILLLSKFFSSSFICFWTFFPNSLNKFSPSFSNLDLYKIKAKYINNQILDEINGEIKSIEEKLLEQSKELDEAKKEIINGSI